ncbi:MAG TPA: hypothetical protein VGD91_14585 [Trebonia sp.]
MRDAGAAAEPGDWRAAGAGANAGAEPSLRRPSGRTLRMGFVLDVEGYGTRPVPDRDGVQQRLRQLVVAMLAECGLKLDSAGADHQWTGDGINAILPGNIDPTVVLTVLIRSLAAGLREDNARHPDRIRLRMAVGVGLTERSVAGFGGPVIVDINRLVDSAVLRSALADEPNADLAVAVSDQAHALIIQPGYPGIPGSQFTRVNAVVKEFSAAAWIWVSTRQWSEPPYLPPVPADPREAGRYRVVARLGTGQAGRVYLATGGDPLWAALKVFDARLVTDPDVRRRLSVGALAASVVREPHLAPVVDYGDHQGHPWVASTLVRGPSLAAAVTETGPLPAAAAGWIALGLSRALGALHEAGLTHHAVSPQNVLLDASRPMLTDFGVSRAALVSGPGTAAEDLLMLGAATFYAATGRSPWGDRLGDAAPAVPAVPSGPADLDGCPPWLLPVVRACLDPDPAARPSPGDLRTWITGEIGQPPRSWLPDPVAARLADYQELPPSRGRFRWPRGRE